MQPTSSSSESKVRPRFRTLLLVKKWGYAVELERDAVGPLESRQNAHDPFGPHPLDHLERCIVDRIQDCLDSGLAAQHYQRIVIFGAFHQLLSTPASPHAYDELVGYATPEHISLYALIFQFEFHQLDVSFISVRL